MNNSKIFVLVIALLLVVAVLIELSVPKRFQWEPTFSHDSKQPFGCTLFDSLAKSSMKNGYSVKHTTFYQLLQDSTIKSPISVIDIYSSYLKYDEGETKRMLDFVSKGNKVLLCADEYSLDLKDTLQVLVYDDGYFNFRYFRRAATHGLILSHDSIIWGGDSVYPKNVYHAYSDLCSSYYMLKDTTTYNQYIVDNDTILTIADVGYDEDEVTVESDSGEIKQKLEDVVEIRESSPEWKPMAWMYGEHHKMLPVVMKRKWGKGEIYLCSTPLLFTNYGILNKNNVSYVYRVLNSISDRPVMRIVEKPLAEEHISQSPMRFFLANPPLRWALYLGLVTLLLFFIFTARRRQRAIPVVKKPENHQLEFTKLIGTLYYQDGNHADLARKKYSYFAEFLRREVQIDIDEDADDNENFSMLARHTGMSARDLGFRIKATRRACRSNSDMTVEEMTMYIDYMNEIEKKLTN